MLLKKIILNNIRSYEKQEIEFPEGSTLLWGDIGSGKTSILLGIEFALFGLQPGQRGSSILRNGSSQGKVSIEFEIDRKNILVERTLKKGSKSISQDTASITIDGEKKELSVTELKNRVLELLNYPREFSKKQNILYKFTVYTPQEEMKQIILQDSETRINTLRHVFGIDKYKTILENTSLLLSKIREEKRFKEAITSNLDKDKTILIEKENELETKQLNLSSIEKEVFLKSENRKNSQEELEEISKKIQEKNKLKQEIEKTKIMISSKNNSISDNQKIIQQLKSQIEELEQITFDENKISEIEKDISIKKNKKQTLNEENLEITSRITSLNLKNQENEKIKEKIKHLESCPTCLQEVDSVYKSNVLIKMDSEISENVKLIQELTLEKQEILQETNKTEYEISLNEKEIQELKILKIKIETLNEKKEHIANLENSNATILKDIEFLESHINTLQISVFELNKFDNLFEEKQKQLDEALKEEKLAEIKVAELRREIEVFSNQIQELKEKIHNIEESKKQLIYLSDLEDWISKNFIPLISNVEKNVMVKLKSEFSKLFSEWFSMLVAENFNVSLDDNFTPIIEQQDYEINYAYLSGGERTAIALAYRLALNQVINSLISKIKTKDLVILDEPTDGFSDAQLDKMRNVLEQLNVAQLILVSHEQKIEGFVENVIKFRKENGISCLES